MTTLEFRPTNAFIQEMESLFCLEDSQLEKFLASLQSSESTDDLTDFIHECSESITIPTQLSESGTTPFTIGATIKNILTYRASNSSLTIKEQVDAICISLNQSRGSIFFNDQKLQARVSHFLTSIFSIKNLNNAAKSLVLHAEHENVFYDSKVITDIRPVFNRDTPDHFDGISLEGFLISHQLRITAISSDNRKDFYFSLSDQEIENLIVSLKRAQKKSHLLQRRFEDSNLGTNFSNTK